MQATLRLLSTIIAISLLVSPAAVQAAAFQANSAGRLLTRWLALREDPRVLADNTIAVSGDYPGVGVVVDGHNLNAPELLQEKANSIKRVGIASDEGRSSLINITTALYQLADPTPDRSKIATRLKEEWQNNDGTPRSVQALANRTLAFAGVCARVVVTVDGQSVQVPEILRDKCVDIYNHGVGGSQGSSLRNVVTTLAEVAKK